MARKPKNKPAEQCAYIVPTDGSDDDIRKRCAETVEGWDTLGDNAKTELIARMKAMNARPAAPTMTINRRDDGGCSVAVPEGKNVTLNALRLADTFATKSSAFIDTMIADIVTYHHKANRTGAHATNVSGSLAFVHGANVQDSVQAALAVQMATVHDAAMRSLAAMGAQSTVDGIELYGNISNKLLKTFSRQAEVLAKLQRGGEQVVKHIHIDNRGGQAVVTEQVVTGGVNGKGPEQPHATAAAGVGPALLCQDPLGRGVPIPGDQGQAALPDAWRQGKRRAKG